MADAAELQTSKRGVYVPWAIVLTLVLGGASVGMAYIFATKMELAAHAALDGSRLDKLDAHVDHHDEAITDLKETTKGIDANLRVLMLRSGVPQDQITQPLEKRP